MRLAFILGEIGSGLRRNLSMVVSVILVTFVSLTFVGAAGMLQMQINQMKGYWYDRAVWGKGIGLGSSGVLFTLALIGTLSTIAMPGMLRARSQAGTAAAIGTLRVVNSGQLSYAITCGSGFYAPNLSTLGRMAAGTSQAFVSSDAGAGSEAGVGQGAPRDPVKPDVGWDRLSSADDEDEPPGSGG